MDWDFPPGLALPEVRHDERVARERPTAWRARANWRLTIVLGVLSNLLMVAILVVLVSSPSPRPSAWVVGVLTVIVNALLLLSAWTGQRPFAELRGWQVSARATGRTKSTDLRLAQKGTLRRYNGALYCLLRFHRVKGHPRKQKVPVDGREFREAFLSRLDMLPGLAASGWLRDTIVSHREPRPGDRR